MSFLANFLMENEVTVTENVAKVENVTASIQKSSNSDGHIVIAGSIDWDNVNYGPRGLNELCRIDLSGHVVKDVYSSCSAHHSFFAVQESSSKVALFAMGRNDFGQHGSGDKTTAPLPKKVSNPAGKSVIKSIAVGRYHSILLTESGELFGCGANDCGQLGLGASAVELTWKKIKTILPVVDVSCGFQFTVFCDTAGHVYSMGHPEYGQLGHGSTGEFFAEGRHKLQHNYITKPKRVEEFVVKDVKNKITDSLKYDDLFIVSVSAGRNHVLCLEASTLDATTSNAASSSTTNKGRVFAWGFGGYGRLGHNGTADEMVPRLISTLHSMCNGGNLDKPVFKDNAIAQICAGNMASAVVTKAGRLLLMGIVNNSNSKECNMYPKEVPSLMQSQCRVGSVSLGVSCIYVLAEEENEVYAWGVSQTGVMGFADTKTAAAPKEIDMRGLETVKVSCGYLHTCIVVRDKPAVPKAQLGTKSSSSKGKRPAFFASAMAEPTVCPFVASSHLQSFFPPLEALPELDPEVRLAKRQRKSKSDADAGDENDVEQEADGTESKGKDGEGENYSSDDGQEEEESSSEEEEDDESESGRGRGGARRGGKTGRK